MAARTARIDKNVEITSLCQLIYSPGLYESGFVNVDVNRTIDGEVGKMEMMTNGYLSNAGAAAAAAAAAAPAFDK